MFKIDQTVYTKCGSRQGKVVDIDGTTIYLEQRNGAEVDFPADQLTTTRPLNKLEQERADEIQMDAALDQLCTEVLNQIQPLRDLAARAHGNLTFSSPGVFDTLGGQRQLHFAAILYGVPMEQFFLHHTQGTMEILKLTIYSKIGRAIHNS